MTFTVNSGGTVSTASDSGYGNSVAVDRSVNTVIYAKPDSGWYFIGCRFASGDENDGPDNGFVWEETTDPSVYQIRVPTNPASQEVLVLFGHKVTIDTRGGEDMEPQYFAHGGRILNSISDPRRDGGEWHFLHWCTDPALTQEFIIGTKVEQDITLYAKWAKGARLGIYNQSNPTELTCGTVDITTSEQNYNQSGVVWPMNPYLPEGPVTYTAMPADGYRFVGWFEGVVGESHFVEKPTGDAISTEPTYTFRGEDTVDLCAVFALANQQSDQDNQNTTPIDQTLSASAPDSLVAGTTAQITASGQGTITYESSNPKVATVNSAGVITALKPGKTTITVRASGDQTYNSAETQLAVAVKYLATPSVTKVENATDGVKVTLKKVSGAAAYRVFYKIGKGSWKKAGDTTTNTFLWKGGKSGTKYTFTVRCIPKTGSGIYSSDFNKTGKSITYVAAPKLTAARNNKAKTVTATWKKVSGINGYELQYSTTKNFKGAKSIVIKKPATVSNAVASLKKGKTYYFRIRSYKSVSGKRVLSGWSTVKTVKIKK